MGVEKNSVESTTTVVEDDTSTSTTLDESDYVQKVEGGVSRKNITKMSQETTAVETMSFERLAEEADKQKAADDVEAGFEKENGDVSKVSEQKVLEDDDEREEEKNESEADEDDDWILPFDEHQKTCPECRKLGE